MVRSHRHLRHVCARLSRSHTSSGRNSLQTQPPSEPTLRRALGLWAAIAMVIGTAIGSGIFLVPSDMIKAVGSPGMVFVVWVFGGILTLFGALTYAELSAALPDAGGEYVYLTAAYGPFFGFIYGWTQTWVAKSSLNRDARHRILHLSGRFLSRTQSRILHNPFTDRSRRRISRNSLRANAGDRPDFVPGCRELPGRPAGRRRPDRRDRAETGADRRT